MCNTYIYIYTRIKHSKIYRNYGISHCMNCLPKASEQISPSSIITSFCVTFSGFLDPQVASRAKKVNNANNFFQSALISACQSQKLHNTKNPPKSDDIKRELWCACYKYEGININLETEHFGTTELCNHHLPSTIKAINFKTTGASNTDSQLSNPTARHRGLGCFNQRPPWPAGKHSHPPSHHYFMITVIFFGSMRNTNCVHIHLGELWYFTNPWTFSIKRLP